MIKYIHLSILVIWSISGMYAQLPDVNISTITKDIYFLASNELQGRKTGEQGNLVAARYLAENFREVGMKNPDGLVDYYQPIKFERRKPATSGSITTRNVSLNQGKEILFLSGSGYENTHELVFVEQGWVNDTLNQYAGIDVAGKVVVSLFGIPGSVDPRDGFGAIRDKMKFAHDNGAAGMIEIYSGGFPWTVLQRFLNREQVSLKRDSEAPDEFQYVLSNNKLTEDLAIINAGNSVEVVIQNPGLDIESFTSPNVIGWIDGTDEDYKDEYVILSAHFDHVGTTEGQGMDNIYNGARDNGMGTTALLAAARYFSVNPPKRSLLFIGFTAEEIGLLGSSHYADNPVKPLHKAIFNMNTDGGGYNDTTLVTIIGHDRVGVWEIFQESASLAGLTATGDPAPEQGLFDRSDNVNFAKMGIPAPTYSPGFTAFDQEIMKYYHKTADNPDQVSMNYLKKFIQSYILATEKIANLPEAPKWRAGDKYEAAFMKLYNIP